MWIGLVDRLRQHLQRLLDGVEIPAGRGFGGVAERIVDLIGGGVLIQPQRPAGAQRLFAPGLDLQHLAAQDRVGADGQPAVGADDVVTDGESDHHMAGCEPDLLYRTDIHPRNADRVAGMQRARIGELAVVPCLREQHRHAGEALPHQRGKHRENDGHHPGSDPVLRFEHPHCGVHLPVGC